MPALSEMAPDEIQRADMDPDLIRACSMTGSIRWLEIYRGYLLQERLQKAPHAERDEILQRWSHAMGVTQGTLKNHLKWAYGIQLEDITEIFALEGIGGNEWTQRVGTSHLHIIARTRDEYDTPLTSRERAEWVRRAYHANLSVAELEGMLRDADLLPPKRNLKTKPIQAGKPTACSLLETLAAHLKVSNQDFELDIKPEAIQQPMKAWKALYKLAELYGERFPKAEFRLSEEKP